MKYKSLLIAALFWGCQKKTVTPIGYVIPPFVGPATIRTDTINRIDLIPSPGIAGDTSGEFFSGIVFRWQVNISADTAVKGDTTFYHFQVPGYLALRYVAADSLLIADSLKEILSNSLDYRLSKNLLGKMLFHGFALYNGYDGDTTEHDYFVAALDCVRVVVQISKFTATSTPESITSGFNSLLYQKLDTSWFYNAYR